MTLVCAFTTLLVFGPNIFITQSVISLVIGTAPSVIADAFLSRLVSRLHITVHGSNCVFMNQYHGALTIVCLDSG